ncbi:SufD family Fe-S cluster assembly protein [candidate division KSB1 bacterium]
MSLHPGLKYDLYKTTGSNPHILDEDNVAHLVINHNKVLGSHLLPGLEADVEETENGIRADIRLKEGVIIRNPVHLCFGMLPENGLQEIIMNINIEDNSKASIFAHCTFPNAIDVEHVMDAKINVGNGAEYSYFERHVHGPHGGVKVIPDAVVELGEGSRFKTEFELLKGKVGKIDITYETTCHAHSVMEMNARINGRGDDDIKINETGYLIGEGARGVLTSRVAVRDNAKAHIYNKLTATAPYAIGHVDCKEIIQDNGTASATPIVEVKHPKAHITHEAAIGSVDSKQLETLMARGLTEDEAVELIIEGLLT